MKILALEKEIPGVRPESFQTHSKAEAARVWELYKEGVLREVHFTAETHEAVLVLECTDRQEAEALLATLPPVAAGLIAFEVHTLIPYPGFARLFDADIES
jgi:hypothetical protein